MKSEKILEFAPYVLMGLFFSILFIAVAFQKPHKYTIRSQDKTYHVDNFRIIGGQLVFDKKDKHIIIKGGYIIEINETDEKREAISTTE